MSFSPLLLTNQGLQALAEAASGALLNITSVQVGSGYVVAGDIQANFTALKNYVMTADSTSVNTLVLYQTTIRCNVPMSSAPYVFQVNEIGVFASLNSQAPFLFAYTSTGAPNGDTVDPSAPIVKDYVLPIVYSTLQSVTATIEMTDVVGLHASTHLPSGVDPIPVSSQTIGGLCPKTNNNATQVLIGGSTAAFAALPLHGPTHVSTGRDPVPISTTVATGLLPVLSGDVTTVLKGDGTWGTNFYPGMVVDYAGYTPPPNWLICDGQQYSRSQFAALYAALGGGSSPWGQGDGVSTFNVPDLRGRVAVGYGLGPGLTQRWIGQTGGEENHVLSVYELALHNHPMIENPHTHAASSPAHAHSVYDPTHAHGVGDPSHTHGTSESAHAHSQRYYEFQLKGESGLNDTGYAEATQYYGAAPPGLVAIQTGPGSTNPNTISMTASTTTGLSINAAQTNIGIAAAATNIQVQPTAVGVVIANAVTNVQTNYTGNNWGHNNMQPYAVLNKIIHV